MKTIVSGLGVLLLLGAAGTAAHAQSWGWNAPFVPDACGPGSYCRGPCGAVYGPNYCVRPPFEPFNGFVPPVCHGCNNGAYGGPPASPVFPTHPYARSPRDYFMIDLP
jgi:hypothetical protein